MTTVITRLFDTYEEAAKAVAELESSGIPHSAISIVGSNTEGRWGDPDTSGRPRRRRRADRDRNRRRHGGNARHHPRRRRGPACRARLAGDSRRRARWSLRAGWWPTLAGAGVGAAGGGLLGSLIGAGVEESEAHVYAEGVRRGGTLVTVRADEGQRATVETVLARYAGVDANARGAEYRAGGWSGFDAERSRLPGRDDADAWHSRTAPLIRSSARPNIPTGGTLQPLATLARCDCGPPSAQSPWATRLGSARTRLICARWSGAPR